MELDFFDAAVKMRVAVNQAASKMTRDFPNDTTAAHLAAKFCDLPVPTTQEELAALRVKLEVFKAAVRTTRLLLEQRRSHISPPTSDKPSD